MVFRELNKEDGYTVAELLIALTIISIVLALASSVFLFVNRQMNTWQANMSFYNNYQVVQNKVFNDILNAEHISGTDTSLTLTMSIQEIKLYGWGTGNIRYLNKVLSINPMDSTVIDVNNNLLAPEIYAWSIRQRNDEKIMEQEFTVHIRKPILWEPLRRSDSGGF